MKEMKPKYNHKEVENSKYNFWIENGFFSSGDKSKKPFCVVIPPPNVTGKLHLGHAWDTSLQDIIVRRKRMQGFDTLYLPGMDHAGIATQAKVDERLKSQGTNRYELGRDKFLEKAWEWKEEYAKVIREQWANLGLSLDYDKERFTLDEGLNQAVNKVFIDMYNKGLIYRGTRAINWDPIAKTALSNIEVIHKEKPGKMYYFKYMVTGTDKYIEVATTRPETMGSDKALVVHPDDSRYKDLVGKTVITPLRKEEVPIITDEYIDIEFGTGAMKCSAHAATDVEILEKYGLPIEECIDDDGRLNKFCLEFEGMTREEARPLIAKRLEAEGLLIKEEDYTHQVGHSERTDAVVEIMVKPQWFVKMDVLAVQALEMMQTTDKVNFIPERFENTFNTWMNNVHDWCISRQLWWGHRIPAWYNGEEIKVQIESPGSEWIQDEDVLDTWFSSALWPFSTLGWPNETSKDYERYFPTNVLVTGYDIIFFWVSRMIFQSKEFMNNKPFDHVLIHGLIRDGEGRKMSKSLGNGVDPMDVVEKYGADSLRHFITTNCSPGQDLRYTEDKVEASWNFINKLWNMARFVNMNLGDAEISELNINYENTTAASRYILNKFSEVMSNIDMNFDKFDFGEVNRDIYNFAWNEYAAWYLELAKIDLSSEDEDIIKGTRSVLYNILMNIVKILHPIMPFVTEEIFLTLPHEESSITISKWPEINNDIVDLDDSDMKNIIEIITAIRNVRSEVNKAPKEQIDIYVKVNSDKVKQGLLENVRYITKFTNPKELVIDVEVSTNEESKTIVCSNLTVIVPMSDLINIDDEIVRLNSELEKLNNEINRCEAMLSNEKFISKAPEQKVTEEKNKLENYKLQYKSVGDALKKLK